MIILNSSIFRDLQNSSAISLDSRIKKEMHVLSAMGGGIQQWILADLESMNLFKGLGSDKSRVYLLSGRTSALLT
jgi:hypothetical protein